MKILVDTRSVNTLENQEKIKAFAEKLIAELSVEDARTLSIHLENARQHGKTIEERCAKCFDRKILRMLENYREINAALISFKRELNADAGRGDSQVSIY